METCEPNLFNEATFELSHSALLSWLFKKAICAPRSEFGECASRLFRTGTEESITEFRVASVEREYSLPVGGQIDLLLRGRTATDPVIWGIETKRGSQASEEQLARYDKGLSQYAVDHESGDSKYYLTLYSTRHIMRGRGPTDWPDEIRRDDVAEILEDLLPDRCQSDLWLLQHYLDWLINQAESFDPYTEPDAWASYTAGAEDVEDPRVSEIVQYSFMRETVAVNQVDPLSWGTSRGRPWTQFKVTEDDPDARQAEEEIATVAGRLLYRMDNRTKKGTAYPYLELRQYTLKPETKDLIEKKAKVADALRELFKMAVIQVLDSTTATRMDIEAEDSSYVESCPYSSVKYRETALSGFHFFEGQHPDLSELCDLFPAIHRQFIKKLKSDTVNEFSVSDELKYLGKRVVRI